MTKRDFENLLLLAGMGLLLMVGLVTMWDGVLALLRAGCQ